MIRVCFLWHMHQPFYKDLVSGEYRMQWTRMHALKDYFGMVEMLRDFPKVRATFNLVPSLLVQLEDYAAGTAREPVLDIVLKPAAELTAGERVYAVAQLFQANRDLISRYPRYRELYERHRAGGFAPERTAASFATQDFADLQVLSQVAWFDEIYLEHDAEIRSLVERGSGFGPREQALVGRKQRELIGRISGAYRAAQDRGQVELSTTPFYHPILPLVCDTNIAGESHPGVPLPRRFRHPEDAELQLSRAIEMHTRAFGRRPAGLWPSEGSVSDQVLGLAAGMGFRWAATGEGVLARSLPSGFARDDRGIPANAAALYSSYDVNLTRGKRIRLFFRDQFLSDLIGFVYSNLDPALAAADLLDRLRRCGRAASHHTASPVIPVILDGENAWEYYARNGREFFGALYRGLSDDSELQTVTFGEALEVPARGALDHVAPGSWINANFDIWIGAEQDNRAWNLLSDARDFFAHLDQQRPLSLPAAQIALAREELLIAEGSDWNWWYGPEHHTANDAQFDGLYRAHLANVYRALGASPPDALAEPIAREPVHVVANPPLNYIRPRIDGYVSSYFEWMGAGAYRIEQRTSAMHGKRFYMEELHYGLDGENFYLRLDLTPEGVEMLARSEIRISFATGDTVARVFAHPVEGDRAGPMALSLRRFDRETTPAEAAEAQARFRRIFEMAVPLRVLGLERAARFRFQVVYWESGLPVDLLPAEAWLEVETAEPPRER